ncbi:MAG: biopolymer transporter ExbD [Myxococcota bacterium]
MAGSVGNQDDEAIAAINVTPFVDVVLVLLIILMVTSTEIVKASLQVDLPKAASGGQAVSTTLNVVVTKDGDLILDGAAVDEQGLADVVKAEKAKDEKAQAVIAADKSVPYGRVVRVIDIVKTNGITSFALNIERAAADTPVGN